MNRTATPNAAAPTTPQEREQWRLTAEAALKGNEYASDFYGVLMDAPNVLRLLVDLDRTTAERDALRTAAEAVIAGHRPESGMGYTDAEYGSVDPACTTCGTTDEYAVPWPCRTVLTLRAVLSGGPE